MKAEQMASLQPALMAWLEQFDGCFRKSCTFEHWRTYVLGLLSDLKRKNVEAIALAADVAVRSLQEFLSQFRWDDERLNDLLQQWVADAHGGEQAIGVIDESGHPKQGDKTPGVQHQYCGETGKLDNCVVGVHLLYTNNEATNPFTAMLESELYLPESWQDDAARRAEAGIPEHLFCRPKWLIAAEQVEGAIGHGIRFGYVVFDEEYGKVPNFWFTLDGLGQRGIGEVPANFYCWPTPPKYRSFQGPFGPKRVDSVVRRSPVFRNQDWQTIKIKDTTRGASRWQVKAARVQLVDKTGGPSRPTDRRYWLIVARNPQTDEIKYFVSNATAKTALPEMLQAAFARWHVEKWFERAKQETGFGDFEVRKYTGLMRHWLCARMAMCFLAEQTTRLRGEKCTHHVRAGGPGRQDAAGEDRQRLASILA